MGKIISYLGIFLGYIVKAIFGAACDEKRKSQEAKVIRKDAASSADYIRRTKRL
jgi:hypothetical protein